MHQLWHITVLAAAVLGGGAALLLVFMPLAFDEPPQGFARYRPWLVAVAALAAALVVVEWTVVH
ncbi:MAG TPA: hypothetical protein VNC78_10740 [Actinomycetota bacterium]|nr:hypothetical protein [Actinomycetota bacterium]